MLKEFLMIHKDVLPPCYEQVIKANKLIEHEGKSVSDVCKELDISRSTFYKYKDKVFELSSTYAKKAIISFRTEHEKGVLSNILNTISSLNGNVLTINQDMPLHNMAYITIALETGELSVSVYELIAQLKKLPKIKEVNLLAFE